MQLSYSPNTCNYLEQHETEYAIMPLILSVCQFLANIDL